MTDTVRLDVSEARTLSIRAATGAGASDAAAASLAEAAVAAERAGKPAVGLAHLLDYLEALRAGRIDGTAEPRIDRPTPILFVSDAGGGIAHLGFDRCLDGLIEAAGQYGMAAFAQRNAFTCGELGHFTRRPAQAGLVALAATNGPALLAGSEAKEAVFCTNPMSFAAPRIGGPPLVIDQSSSATAFVNIRRAAANGEAIPDGWAIGPDGQPTADAAQAMKGALLPFGGARGGNIALMVEVLAAGLSAANWSLDAPSFIEGSESPGTGLFVAVLDPGKFAPNFAERLGAHLDRLAAKGVHIPGGRGTNAGAIELPADIHERLSNAGA